MDAASQLDDLGRSLATITFAPDGTILHASEHFLRLTGYEAQEIVGRRRAILLPGDEAALAADRDLWDALERGETRSVELRLLGNGGAELWLQAAFAPAGRENGKVSTIVACAFDVTTQKRQALLNEALLKAADGVQAVVHLTLDGIVTYANDLFLAMLGYEHDDVVGRPHRTFLAPSTCSEVGSPEFWSALAGGHRQSAPCKHIGKDGREIWVQATFSPIFDGGGQLYKIVEHAADVTEERLRQADYAGLITAINKSQGIVTFAMNGTIIDANPCFLDAVGYSLEEVTGRHHRMFVDASYAHGPEYATFWFNLSQGHHQAGEYRRYGKDGREIWLNATYNPVLDLNGRPFKIVKFATVVTREKLRQADLQGQIASIHKAQCVISFGLDGTILDANDHFLAATDYKLAEILGRHHRMFVDEAEAASPAYAAFWRDLAEGRYQAAEYKRFGKGGREIWLQATYNPIFDMNGRPFKVVKYAIDITEERLQQADYQGQIAAIRKSQCVATFDMDATIVDANENFLKAFGYGLADIKGRHHRMFVEPGFADTDQYRALWDKLRSGSFMSGKFKRLGKGGRDVWIQASYNPILDPNGRPFKVIKIATDVTADMALAADLSTARQQVEHDAATGLPNRIRLSKFMTSALAVSDGRLTVLYLDLDHFKPINDSFGHHVGDHVLRETADRLRRVLRSDQIVARIGGDEFAVGAPNLSDEEIETLCQRLITVVTAPIRHEKGTLHVGLSIGVASSPTDAATADDLMRCADVALYRTKGNGRGSYTFFAKAANDRIVATRHLADDMRHGIKAEQFFLEYQPRFNARTRAIQSVEALVRWAHPERGLLQPADFIPVAEKSGLIVLLGAWVLRSACHMAKAWPGIAVSVNISPVQFLGSDLIDVVGSILSETGLEAKRLELEITEEALIEDEDRAHAMLSALKSRGVRLAMADFGTGMSSLGHLRAFPFDVIKINRRVLAEIEGQDGGRGIVQAILKLGEALGLSVTAEGVESAGQLLRLSLDERAEVQGFLLAPPMPANAVSALLERRDEALAQAS